MCTRFYINDNLKVDLSSWIDIPFPVRSGEVCPTDLALTISMGSHGSGFPSMMRFGYAPSGRRRELLLNARVESVSSRPTFATGIDYHRCVIPASAYFEWNTQKEKVKFEREDGSPLYLAGIYDLIENQRSFTILTTQANASVREVHDRMPLILERDMLGDWLSDRKGRDIDELLHTVPGPLLSSQEYKQLSFHF